MSTPLNIHALRADAADTLDAQIRLDREAMRGAASSVNPRLGLLAPALHREVIVPGHLRDRPGTQWMRDSGTLWDAAERQASGDNPIVARRLTGRFPPELRRLEDLKQHAGIFSKWVAEHFGVAVDYAIRRDSKSVLYFDGLVTPRQLGPQSFRAKSRLEPNSTRVEDNTVSQNFSAALGEIWQALGKETVQRPAMLTAKEATVLALSSYARYQKAQRANAGVAQVRESGREGQGVRASRSMRDTDRDR